MQDLLELLRNNPYPGRGIVVGKGRVYYWIMGRSANSRNRVFTPTEDGIRTEAHDPALLEDPSLIIYHPVRTMGEALVVTNGDQTDTIVEKGDFRHGLPGSRVRARRSQLHPAHLVRHQPRRLLRDQHPQAPRRPLPARVLLLRDSEIARGYFISTYQGDGNPLPTFAGEPVEVTMPEPDEVWAALNADNKVSLYANVDGAVSIYNKNLGD